MWQMRIGHQLYYGVGEDSWESLLLWCWRWLLRVPIIVVLEKTLESPLDSKEIQPVHPKGYQSLKFIGRTDTEADTLATWSKNWLIWKDPDAGKDWRWEEKGMTEDEMVGWHHWLNGYKWVNSGSWWWTERPGGLQSTGSHMTERLKWTELIDYKTAWNIGPFLKLLLCRCPWKHSH